MKYTLLFEMTFESEEIFDLADDLEDRQQVQVLTGHAVALIANLCHLEKGSFILKNIALELARDFDGISNDRSRNN